jgi:large subunit ribosomal protein L10
MPFLFWFGKEECRLAITRAKKEELLESYKEHIKGASALVFTNYRGTNVAKIRSLRNKLSESGTQYVVVKNSLLGIALEQTGNTKPDDLLVGPNAVAFLGEDIGKSVTALMDWIKAEKMLEIVGALLGPTVLDPKGAESLAALPSKEQVRAQVLGALLAPGGALARMLNAPTSSLARVINAHVGAQQAPAAGEPVAAE